ncbi:hypothetical protein GCM10010358_26010 [Streptomyces minutiscleroticus]|uniref:Uncharacterized protein n=1 Tax=Streptomyces minutiscleroticus TaxID=68238 RepID=A0A918KR83_9ACTN|nr:hypothetical protein GCM10010358_26010 [Streptomyces minutiscleroticus]
MSPGARGGPAEDGGRERAARGPAGVPRAPRRTCRGSRPPRSWQVPRGSQGHAVRNGHGELTRPDLHGVLRNVTDTYARLWRRVHMDLVRYAGCVCRPSC